MESRTRDVFLFLFSRRPSLYDPRVCRDFLEMMPHFSRRWEMMRRGAELRPLVERMLGRRHVASRSIPFLEGASAWDKLYGRYSRSGRFAIEIRLLFRADVYLQCLSWDSTVHRVEIRLDTTLVRTVEVVEAGLLLSLTGDPTLAMLVEKSDDHLLKVSWEGPRCQSRLRCRFCRDGEWVLG